MRISVSSAINTAAWVVLVVLIGFAVIIADVLGFLGLLLLGVAIWLVCVRAELDKDVPTWSAEVLRARLHTRGSPEQQAAMMDERRTFMKPLKFYRWCGICLTAAGTFGFLLQHW